MRNFEVQETDHDTAEETTIFTREVQLCPTVYPLVDTRSWRDDSVSVK